MTDTLTALTDIAFKGLLFLSIAGCVATFFIGLSLIARPGPILRASERMNQWFARHQPMKPLQKTIKIERYVYRRHRYFGALVLSGAAFTLYSLLYRYNERNVVEAYTRYFNRTVVEWVVQSAAAALALGTVCAALIGLVMLIRPSLLKGIEAWSNRQYHTPNPAKLLYRYRVHGRFDHFATSHPHLAGLIISLASLYVLLNFAFFL